MSLKSVDKKDNVLFIVGYWFRSDQIAGLVDLLEYFEALFLILEEIAIFYWK